MSEQSERPALELLEDIVTWGERIPELLGEMAFDEFRRDYRTHLAVWKCIEVIGEASGHLLKRDLTLHAAARNEFRSAYLMRNRLSHGYPGVDLGILWSTARDFVPPLVDFARREIARFDLQ